MKTALTIAGSDSCGGAYRDPDGDTHRETDAHRDADTG